MKKPDYKKWLPKAVVTLLCFFFIGGMAWGLESVLSMEGTMTPVENREGLTPCPKTAVQAVDFLNRVVAKAVTERPKLSSADSFEIHEDSITSGGPQQLTDTLKYIRQSAQDSLNASFNKIFADYGEDFSSTLWLPDISADDVESFECDYIYYVCPSCAVESDTPLSRCDKCGSERPYEMHYRDTYSVVLRLKETGQALSKTSTLARNFRIRSSNEIDALIDASIHQYLSFDRLDVSYSNAVIAFTVDRMTDRVTQLSYSKDADVSADISFIGGFAELGKSGVVFSLSENVVFDFTWPGISLSAHTLTVDKKATDTLVAALTCADSKAVTVEWSSSDDSVARVDGDGNVRGGKKAGTATITASFEFLGKRYSDSCVVSVRTPVKSIRLSKRSLTLKPGETYRLKAHISPKKADIKTVSWYTTDDSVATVDADGVVTAVSPGKAEVYALTDDGWYKSTCKTEVTRP